MNCFTILNSTHFSGVISLLVFIGHNQILIFLGRLFHYFGLLFLIRNIPHFGAFHDFKGAVYQIEQQTFVPTFLTRHADLCLFPLLLLSHWQSATAIRLELGLLFCSRVNRVGCLFYLRMIISHIFSAITNINFIICLFLNLNINHNFIGYISFISVKLNMKQKH